jgi:hypothetical protein|tara:strand:+ start:715 stop:933 length:219 start_codon:yes stop_codon:yes gene_type:complete
MTDHQQTLLTRAVEALEEIAKQPSDEKRIPKKWVVARINFIMLELAKPEGTICDAIQILDDYCNELEKGSEG